MSEQSQDSLLAQLRALHAHANRLGLYDAADWLAGHLPAVTECRCPYCGRVAEVATEMVDDSGRVSHAPIAGGIPHNGDASICWGCGRLGIFTGNGMEVRRPTATERETYLEDREIVKVMTAWQEYQERMR